MLIGPIAARGRPLVRLAIPAALLGGCALLLSGCAPNPQTSLSPQSNVADWIQTLFGWTVVVGLLVVVPVEIMLVTAVLRFRRRPGQVVGPPVGRHGSTRLEVTWTIIPVLILTGIAIATVSLIFKTAEAAPKDAIQVKVIGHQWWWEFQYPQYHITTANELHLPVGQTANFSMISADVIHSFWIPGLDGKRDVLPNHYNNLWFAPRKIGIFPGQCAEFCGVSHAFMYLTTVVQSRADFDAWVRDQQAHATLAAGASAPVRRGAQLVANGTCAGCHTIAGTAAAGKVGPNLTHIGSRSYLSGQLMPNTPQNLAKWIHNSSDFKPGSHMPPQNLSQSDLAAVVSYLESLK